jgi:serine/threonine protein kinase
MARSVMVSARRKGKVIGPANAETRPGDLPEDDLFTSADLFGDMVDETPADGGAPKEPGSRRAPIRIQVCEPGHARDDASEFPDEPALPREEANLLDVLGPEDAVATPIAPLHDDEPDTRGRIDRAALEKGETSPHDLSAAEGTEGPGVDQLLADLALPMVQEGQRGKGTVGDKVAGEPGKRVGVKKERAKKAEPDRSALLFHARPPKREGDVELDLAAIVEEAMGPSKKARLSGKGAPSADDRVFGPYRLLEKVASGGMAEVFRAKRTGVEGFEKVLAVKRILRHLSDNKEFVDMFINEAKMVAGLTHPNIVQIYDLGKIEKTYFIAMEYVHGRDLRTIARRARDRGMRVPLDLSVLVISRVCAALDYAHRKRDDTGRPMLIVHRDVSPQNILISFDGDVKLTDFGIARAASMAPTTDSGGALRGKLLYMSPEQAWGRTVDCRSDIFSLGIVFYEMITDQKPFAGGSDLSVLEQVRACRVTPPRVHNARIPERIERVVLKALDSDPENRYQDAGEMHKDLERVLHERQPPTVTELARFMEILFEDQQPGPGDNATDRDAALVARKLEVDLDGSHADAVESFEDLLKEFKP